MPKSIVQDHRKIVNLHGMVKHATCSRANLFDLGQDHLQIEIFHRRGHLDTPSVLYYRSEFRQLNPKRRDKFEQQVQRQFPKRFKIFWECWHN